MAALLLLGALAGAQETRRYGKKGAYTIDLPASWQVEMLDRKEAVIHTEIRVSGLEQPFNLTVYEVTGVSLAPHLQVRYELAGQLKSWKATSHELGFDPLPWLRMTYKSKAKGSDRIAVYTFGRRRGRGIHTTLVCEPADYPKIKDGYFAAALSVRCLRPRWPRVPEGYDRHEQDGLVFLTAPDVDADDGRRVRKIVLDTQEDFVKLHGPIVRPPDEPPVVLLHAYAKRHRKLSQGAAEASHGHYCEIYERRLFAVPVSRVRTRSHARLVSETHHLLFVEFYGDLDPYWVYRGEAKLFAMRAQTGRSAPIVTEKWFDRFGGLMYPLDLLDKLYDKNRTSFVDHGTGYVLYFRHGPAKVREVFEAYLKAYRASGDLLAARKAHLDPLELDEVREKASAYLARKLKPARSR